MEELVEVTRFSEVTDELVVERETTDETLYKLGVTEELSGRVDELIEVPV